MKINEKGRLNKLGTHTQGIRRDYQVIWYNIILSWFHILMLYPELLSFSKVQSKKSGISEKPFGILAGSTGLMQFMVLQYFTPRHPLASLDMSLRTLLENSRSFLAKYLLKALALERIEDFSFSFLIIRNSLNI